MQNETVWAIKVSGQGNSLYVPYLDEQGVLHLPIPSSFPLPNVANSVPISISLFTCNPPIARAIW